MLLWEANVARWAKRWRTSLRPPYRQFRLQTLWTKETRANRGAMQWVPLANLCMEPCNSSFILMLLSARNQRRTMLCHSWLAKPCPIIMAKTRFQVQITVSSNLEGHKVSNWSRWRATMWCPVQTCTRTQIYCAEANLRGSSGHKLKRMGQGPSVKGSSTSISSWTKAQTSRKAAWWRTSATEANHLPMATPNQSSKTIQLTKSITKFTTSHQWKRTSWMIKAAFNYWKVWETKDTQ